ncbi:hypothetical protein Ocin01_18336 [Orchesella cincta]|uniref:Uncharacterized protein n=1 Tax=Orchesella cincta TaxID=48709 RepID=A0A1D2M5U3_ORCCI|nr:hypothetical protein Ocin01_18336 [Orchesella cincta]
MGLKLCYAPQRAIFWLPFLPEFFLRVKTKDCQVFPQVPQSLQQLLGAALASNSQYEWKLIPTWLEFLKFNFYKGGVLSLGFTSPAWYFYSGLQMFEDRNCSLHRLSPRRYNLLRILFSQRAASKPRTTFISQQQISEMDKPRVWLLAPCYSVPVRTRHIHHPNVELQYYICGTQQFRQLYKDGGIHSPNGFSTVDLEADITNKLTTAESPHFILAFENMSP